MTNLLAEQIKNAPHTPGVYLMKDKEGQVLYVGKAGNLKTRIRAYFGGTDSRFMIPFLVSKVSHVEFITTQTEKEALILENNLIKEHRPRYNVYFRDDKTYFSLKLTVKHPFPRYQLVRRVRQDGERYFGPYPSSTAAKETLRFLQPIFPLRTCRDEELKARRRPCLEYEIGRCLAPCTGLVDKESYHRLVTESTAFLEGRERKLINDLRKRMDTAAGALHFEEAADLRDRIAAIEETLEKQRIISMTSKEQDVFGLYREQDLTMVCVLFIRQGKLIGKKTLPLIKIGVDNAEIISSTLKLYYDGGSYIPDELVIPLAIEDVEVMAEWLSDRKGKNVSFIVPKRGQNKALLEIANRNAEDTLRTARLMENEPTAALISLAKILGLKKRPQRIECFDISNIGGKHAVGSMVTFVGGDPWKQDYRRFRIRSIEGADDYGMMYEVLKRRYEGKGNLPDLVMVDGGKGQLGVALSVLKDLSIEGIDVISLAKAEKDDRKGMLFKSQDRVYLPRKKEPLYLSRWPAVLFLLQRIRDEAHRFAISYHRRLKEKHDLMSLLDDITGVGPARKKALLQHFGDTNTIRNASINDLLEVSGINYSLAETIYAFFKNT